MPFRSTPGTPMRRFVGGADLMARTGRATLLRMWRGPASATGVSSGRTSTGPNVRSTSPIAAQPASADPGSRCARAVEPSPPGLSAGFTSWRQLFEGDYFAKGVPVVLLDANRVSGSRFASPQLNGVRTTAGRGGRRGQPLSALEPGERVFDRRAV